MAETKTSADGAVSVEQPGQVITPGQTPVKPAKPAEVKAPAPPAPQVQTVPAKEPVPTGKPLAQSSDNGTITWTASEFVSHEKSASWYGALLLVTTVTAALIYLMTRDIISTSVVVIAALAFAVFAARKPRQLQYRLDGNGITIGQKHHNYGSFKSFAVAPEGAFSSIVFTPLKRFAPLTTIYYAPEDEDKIVSLLTDRLPFEEHRLDAVDNMMRRIRF